MTAYIVEVNKVIVGEDNWGYTQHQKIKEKKVFYAKSKAHIKRIMGALELDYVKNSIKEIN